MQATKVIPYASRESKLPPIAERQTAVVVKIDPGAVWSCAWEEPTLVDVYAGAPRPVDLPHDPIYASRASCDRWITLVSEAQAHGAELQEAIALADDIARSLRR